MIQNKIIIEGKVVSIGEWKESRKGDHLRDFFVEAPANRTQFYCLTQFESAGDKAAVLTIGVDYRFEAYVNGLQIVTADHGTIHVNKICVAKLWKAG